ncbi:DNA binding domain-containing protein, excisionase family [Desulfonatronum zhilinae]|nr:DNA binding domain-containing protein, excisionase family [Desulfonatronum zhilinae]
MTSLQQQVLNERIFITPFEASKMLRVSISYVYRLVQDRRLQGTRELPIRITTASFKAFLEERNGEKPASF